MEFRAQARFVRVSPQKARLVLDLIKGRRVEEALNTLTFTKKRVAARVEKLLRSAVENANYLSAEKNFDVDVDSLYVKYAVANDGPRMKRIRPAPMGRAFRYVRRITHIDLILAERGKKDDTLATVVGEEKAETGTKTAPKINNKKKTKTRAVAKKFSGKKATTRR
jgi:large subunit ribosomal protein L22